jgi:BirA family biotin operon repressor/biotin-[acetyl-CoA-carboxylase] ligase
MVDLKSLHELIKTRILTPIIQHYVNVVSTNKLAKDLIENGTIEGTIVIADEQSAGKGRHDRTWWSPLGGLYMSLVIDLNFPPEETPLLGLLAGCAIVESIETLAGLKPRLKWPNDVMLNGKKMGGILCELVEKKDKKYSVILGIGINQNISLGEIPLELQDNSTSIKVELGLDTSRERLIALIINSIDSRLYQAESKSSLKFIVQEWAEVTSTIGKYVEIMTEKRNFKGDAIGISDIGSLRLSTDEGVIDISTGDVIHLGAEKINSHNTD